MLHTLVTENILNNQYHTSVIYDPGDGDTDTLYKISYSLMGQQISEVASVFSSICTKGQVVGVLLADCAEIPSIYLGLLTASCAFYPINIDGIHYTVNTLKRMAVSFIVAHAQFSEKLQFLMKQLDGHEIKSEVMFKFGLQLYRLQHGSPMPVSSNMCHDLAYCITTSGTTNKPKIVRVPHSCIVPNVLHLRKIFQLGPGDKMLLTAPLTFDPSIIDIFCTLSSGACLVIVPTEVKYKPDKLLSILHERQAITALQATPSLMKSFSPSQLQQTILGPQTALKVLALGGEKFPARDVRSWLHKDNVTTRLYNLYGITEVSCWATCHPVDVEYLRASEATVPIGTALDKTEVKVVPVESDEENSDEGSIWIGSRERICIIDDETVKSQNLKEGDPSLVWRNSGDMGRLLPDGNIVCLDRMDDQVKRHGKRLNLGAIELACKELPEVSDCCALLNENVLMAFVTFNNISVSKIELSGEQTSGDLQETASCSTHNFTHSLYLGDFHREHDQFRFWKKELEIKLKDHVQETLPRHYIPDTFVIIDGAFPLTSHGKLNKKQLLEMGAEALGKNPRAETTDLTEFVRQLWQNHLPESAMTIESTDNFISLGGDSFAVVQLINEVENICSNSWPLLFDLLVNKTFSTFTAELKKYVDVEKLRETQMTSVQRISSSTVLTGNSIIEINSQSERSKANEGLLETALLAITASPADQATSPHVAKHKIYNDGYTDSPPKYGKTDVEFSSSGTVTQQQEVMSLSIQHLNQQSESEIDVSDEKLSVHFKLRKVISRGNLGQRKVDEKIDAKYHSGHYIDCVYSASERNNLYESETNSTSVPSCEISREAKLSLGVKWKFDTKKCVDASPLILEYETVICAFIGSHSGQFSAIDVQHGISLWSVTLPDRIESSACSILCGQSVVVGCYDGCVYFLNSMNGSVIWRFVTQDVVKCSPVVDESSGNIIIGSHDGFLYCLNFQIKQCVWKSFLGGGSVFSSPVIDVSRHIVYAANLSGKVIALYVNSGTEIWTVDLGKPIFSSLCLLEDCVLVGCVDKNLYCLTSEGQIKWTFRTQAPVFSSPTVWDSTIVIGSHDQHIYCISQTGKLLWKFRTTDSVYTTAYVAWLSNAEQCCEDTASHFSSDNLPDMIDSESSRKISKGTSQSATNFIAEVSTSEIDSSPTKTSDKICQTQRAYTSLSEMPVSSACSKQYLRVLVSASTDGNLYVLDHKSGRPFTQVNLPSEVFSSPVIVDRTVVVGCRDNFVYCFEIT